ncbi:permease prefix domain 1-containing protein [Vagococcus hydrophili]|uniref:Beta-carotene 15,15'-monooxygenase n=1 Tax=Vagococcus hydrophili TaxID=2714947 RepID=A0A6G8AQK7_9ENTE|nr:permease prefix domain 1-containing protein [Vagococcus hydrophili]QIL47286.1 hypothetical protein G7082_01420 [Vagococcus hydrophili]
MITIKNYVDTMFMNLAETQELMNLKNDILSNMEEKYEELIGNGASENEAIGLVISEFGSIDELLSELNIEENKKDEQPKFFSNKRPTISTSEIQDYLKMRREVGVGIGLGVLGCGLAIASLLIGIHFNLMFIGLAACLLIVSCSVGMFVVNGLKFNRFNHLEKGFMLTIEDKKNIEAEKIEVTRSFNASLVIGIVLCILSSVPVIIGFQYTEYFFLYTSTTVVIATIGCFFLIFAGNLKGAYSFLKENGLENSMSNEELNSRLFWRNFNEKFWLIVVAMYLLVSFIFNIWSISWIVFPIAGVLSGLWIKE